MPKIISNNKVSRTGDTLSGNLTISLSGLGLTVINTQDSDSVEAVKIYNSANAYGKLIQFYHTDGVTQTGKLQNNGDGGSLTVYARTRLYLQGGTSMRLNSETWVMHGNSFKVFNTDPDVASVSERFQFDFSSNVGRIFGMQGASGTARDIAFGANNTEYFRLLAASTSLQLIEGLNIILGTTTGSQIGTATDQKVALHGSTPVIQRAGAAQAAVATTGSTQTTPYGYTTAAQADAIVTLVNEIRAALVEKGIIKGSA